MCGNCQTCASGLKKRTEGGMFVRTKTIHKACTFTHTFDAVLYLNKCGCALILNFSPKYPIGGSTKGGISNRVFLAIFAAIFCSFWRTLWHQLPNVDSGWPMHCGSRRVFCRYCIAFHRRCICFLVGLYSVSYTHLTLPTNREV